MATISFNANAETVTETKPAVVESGTLVVPTTSHASGIEGEVSARDIRPPRLSLVQKTGNLADSFTPGSLVYDKSVLLADPKTDLNIVVLRFKKYYQQKLVYGSEEMPLRFDRVEDVRLNGGSLTYGSPNYYEEAADMMLAIEMPEKGGDDLEAFFCNEVDGKFYALALYSAGGTAFGSVGTKVITDANVLLKDGIWTGSYTMSRILKKTAKNSWFVPTMKFAGKLSAEAAATMYALSGR